MSYSYEYPRPAVTVDILLLYKENNKYEILLIKRKNEPYKNRWAMPGGFVDENEDLLVAAKRELIEETGILTENIIQLVTVGTPGRDPRGHTISVVYGAVIDEKIDPNAGDDADDASWFDIDNLPELAFDHLEILETQIQKLIK